MRLVGLLSRAATVWRRSIQARVVVSTLLLSAVVVTLVGIVLLRQITDGLVAGKTRTVVAEATRGAQEAQTRLEGAPGTEFDSADQLGQLVAGLVARGDVQGYDVVLDGPLGQGEETIAGTAGTFKSPDVLTESIPDDLRRTVESRAGTSYTYARLRYEAGSERNEVPGVVAGSRIGCPATGGPTRCTTSSR
jgi:two-component system sensor histidine kinase MtrB